MTEQEIQLAVIGILLIGIFFIIRGLLNWYWRINERVELLKRNNQLLNEILIELQSKHS